MDAFVKFRQFFWPKIRILIDIEQYIVLRMQFRRTFHTMFISSKKFDIEPIYGPKNTNFEAAPTFWTIKP